MYSFRLSIRLFFQLTILNFDRVVARLNFHFFSSLSFLTLFRAHNLLISTFNRTFFHQLALPPYKPFWRPQPFDRIRWKLNFNASSSLRKCKNLLAGCIAHGRYLDKSHEKLAAANKEIYFNPRCNGRFSHRGILSFPLMRSLYRRNNKSVTGHGNPYL